MRAQTNEIQHELANLGRGAHALAIQIMGNSEDAADDPLTHGPTIQSIQGRARRKQQKLPIGIGF